MADYALVSAMQKLFPLPISLLILTRDVNYLYRDLEFFRSFISHLRHNKVRSIGLEQQIEDIADKIEDLIAYNFSSFGKLLEVIQDITSLKDKLKKEEYDVEKDPPPIQFLSADDELLLGCYDSILGNNPHPVGLKGQIMRLTHKVMRGSFKLKYVVVSGMAGCGKTTLVKHVYPRLGHFFEIHGMLTIALNCTLRDILICLLTSLGSHFDAAKKEMVRDSELGMSLKNFLTGKRYLLVFDNLWNSNVWNQLKQFFPDEYNRSRIICISRDRVITGSTLEIDFLFLRFLNDDDSWKLLHDAISPTEKSIDPPLEEIGREIAKKCEGLPLAITSMGKLLRESEMSIKRWKTILEDDDPFQIKRSDGKPISRSLYLSYDSLPYHLKLCFLYTGVLPQNHQMKRSDIIMLWIAEGFISYSGDKSLEDKAFGYFSILKQKNMILYEDGLESSTVRVHFVYRSLCIREAEDEQFSLAIKKYVKFSRGTNLQRRLCIHNNTVMGFKEMHDSLKSMSHLSSIVYCGLKHQYPLRVCLDFKCLKILHTLSIRFYEFPLEVLELFHLRYLAITYGGSPPTSISKLQKLEFLILEKHHNIRTPSGPLYLPKEIWTLQYLKHIQCSGFELQAPNSTYVVLKHLSRLSGVSAYSCTPNILARIRNLKKLKVCLELKEGEYESFSFFHDVAQYLHFLESFKCVVLQVFSSHVVPPVPVFPTYIRKLSLSGCGFSWKYTSAISVLPNLTKLKLQSYAFVGPVWEVPEGGFQRLEDLVMKDLDIKDWKAKSHQFPTLFSLSISHCYNLQEIPIEFGDLPKFRIMQFCCNNVSLEKSLRQMQLRRQHFEGDMLEIGISKLDGTQLHHYLPLELHISEDVYISTTLEVEAKKT